MHILIKSITLFGKVSFNFYQRKELCRQVKMDLTDIWCRPAESFNPFYLEGGHYCSGIHSKAYSIGSSPGTLIGFLRLYLHQGVMVPTNTGWCHTHSAGASLFFLGAQPQTCWSVSSNSAVPLHIS